MNYRGRAQCESQVGIKCATHIEPHLRFFGLPKSERAFRRDLWKSGLKRSAVWQVIRICRSSFELGGSPPAAKDRIGANEKPLCFFQPPCSIARTKVYVGHRHVCLISLNGTNSCGLSPRPCDQQLSRGYDLHVYTYEPYIPSSYTLINSSLGKVLNSFNSDR